MRLFAFSSELLRKAARVTWVMMIVMMMNTANTVSITQSVSLACSERNIFCSLDFIMAV